LPVTTVDVPTDLMEYMDKLVAQGLARNRREILVRALANYRKFRMHEWESELIQFYGYRAGILTQRSYQGLIADLNEKQLMEAGRRMGHTLKDLCLANFGARTQNPEHWKLALRIFRDMGAGVISLDNDHITISKPYHPTALLNGYLDTVLGTKLLPVRTVEDVAIFQIKRAKEQDKR
jgi:hypothetical protein